MRHIPGITVALGLAALAASAYIVKEGDTLWDISDEYLNDPFAWPDLWENNKHIQDPHWIYPGDSIYLGAADSKPTAKPKQPEAPCATFAADSTLPKGVSVPKGCSADAQGQFEKNLGSLSKEGAKKNAKPKQSESSYFYSQRPGPKIFNGYYQVLSPIITDPDSLKNDSTWFSIRSGEKKEPLVHMPETEVVVGIGRNTSEKVKAGDIVEIWDARRTSLPETKTRPSEKAAVLRFAGLARITDVGDTLSRAILLQSMYEVKMEYAKARLHKPYAPINVSGYSPVKETSVDSMAMVRLSLEKNLVVVPYAYIMIDRGADGGYSLGDGVAIWEKDLSDSLIAPRLLGRGVVTSLGKDRAVILVREAYTNSRRIQYGNIVSITHKASLVP